MEQIEVSKQLSDKSCDVFKAIVKPTESCERVVLPSLNRDATTGCEAPCMKTSYGGVKLNGCGAYPYVYTLGREGGNII